MTCIPKRKFQLRQGGKCTCNFFAMRLQSAASCAPVLDNSWPIQRRRFQDFDNFWTLRPPTALLHIRLESPSQTGKGWRMIKIHKDLCIWLYLSMCPLLWRSSHLEKREKWAVPHHVCRTPEQPSLRRSTIKMFKPAVHPEGHLLQ